ncbi:MAG: enoyl-CoA hydratase/isomerase family protein [Porticoccaceae bacterium]|nr:enoyl-CoA hydratase/isomerase family protein [Pseudomonadales bacterium]MCP5171141.1 enoyl-CoA hydratase/isomerase family protein [Pseudomonadales bacterium]MCP5301621.1 enoyl-CoA hydratase/isomerase family protein [Pseudomonadales bacterium]
MTSPILIDNNNGVETVTLNRAEQMNAIDVDMAKALSEYFTQLASRKEVRVVILRSEGKHFSAGADLDSPAFVKDTEGRIHKQLDMQQLYSGIIRAMRYCPQPIICLIQGAAVGGGFSLTLGADVRIGCPNTRVSAAYLRIGLGGCDMGSGYLLPRLIGMAAASELLLTGNFMHAERALTTGLLSQVVELESLLATGESLAEDMLKASPLGLRLTKETLNMSLNAGSFDAALTMEDRQQVMLHETFDHTEAVDAFKEKRAPIFEDK